LFKTVKCSIVNYFAVLLKRCTVHAG